MPFIFRRSNRISPDFPAVPAEPSPDRDDKRIAGLNAQITQAYQAGDIAKADRLLDMRNAIRKARPAPVPVVPGRVDSIIDNRLENP